MGLYIRGPGISLTFTAAVMMPEVRLPRRGLGSSRLSLFLGHTSIGPFGRLYRPLDALQAFGRP